MTAAASSSGNLAADFAGILPAFSVTASPSGSAGGALTLDLGDVTNPADGDASNDSFLVVVATRVANVLGNQAGTALVNRASLTFTDPESGATTINAPDDPDRHRHRARPHPGQDRLAQHRPLRWRGDLHAGRRQRGPGQHG